jgi:ABC-type glycerol-3-phosphate transport system permease component
MFISSLKPQSDIFAHGLNLIPSHASLDNYVRLFSTLPFPRWFLNSVLQSACVRWADSRWQNTGFPSAMSFSS